MEAGSKLSDAEVLADHCLCVFGPLKISGPGGVDLTPVGRKARALLAFLLLDRTGPVTRERLAGLLWGSRGDEQARASLRQTLYEMRHLGGPDRPLLRVDRAQVDLDRDRVTTDLDRLQRFAAADAPDALADALGDRPLEPLSDLSGLDPAFDDWLAGERVRCNDTRRRVALDVGQRAWHAGEARVAERLADSLLALDPLDEMAARLAMAAAQARGDEARARQVYERLAAALQRELGTAPSSDTEQTYRALVVVRADAAPMTAVPLHAPPAGEVAPATPDHYVETPSPPTEPATGRPTPRVQALTVTLCACALLVAVTALWLQPRGEDQRRVLRVAPLAALATDPAAVQLGQALPSDLARMIVGNDLRLEVAADDGDAEPEHGRNDLGVLGSARQVEGLLHADVQIVGQRDGTILWSSSFVRPQGELAALREQVAAKLADVAICALGGHNPSLQELGAESMRLYLGACEHKHDDWSLSARLLTQLVQRRPEFAHAWAMLAAGTTAAAYQRPHEADALRREAEGYASHALALDPKDGEAYYARSETLPGLDHWTQRMAVLQAGHGAAPDSALINGRIAVNLASVGRWREAIPYAQLAADEDPFSPAQTATLSTLLAFGPHPEEAQDILERARHRYPTLAWANDITLNLEGLVGDPKRALDLLADPLRPVNLPNGMTDLWRAFLAARLDPTPAHTDIAVAAVYARVPQMPASDLTLIEYLVVLGQTPAAYGLADRLDPHGIDGRQTTKLFHADMAPFRADPRFMGLARRLGLVEIWEKSGHWPDFCEDPTLGFDCRTRARTPAAGV